MMHMWKARFGLAFITRLGVGFPQLARIALAVVLVSLVVNPAASAQTPSGPVEDTQQQAKLQGIAQNKAGYAASIVSRWEADARAGGKWDQNYAPDLFNKLMTLTPDKLLAAGEATSYGAMMEAVASGGRSELPSAQPPLVLGDVSDDLVFTPVTPCRIVDTRNAGGAITGGSSRSFDVDNTTSFASQGGNAGPCGIPFGVATAVLMNITVTQPVAEGFFTAWAVGASQPLASVLNFVTGQTIANSTIIPVLPGGGNDFILFTSATAHAVVDVMGYFAAPETTPPDNVVLASAVTACAAGANCSLTSPTCPASYRMTGGGTWVTVFAGGIDWIYNGPNAISTNVNQWLCQAVNTSASSRDLRCVITCGRIPGR